MPPSVAQRAAPVWERSQFAPCVLSHSGLSSVEALRIEALRHVAGDHPLEDPMQKKTRFVAALAASALALTAACGGGGGDDDNKASGAKELRLWHYESADSAMGKAWNAAIQKFETAHPGV